MAYWFPKTSRKAEKRTQQALLVPENYQKDRKANPTSLIDSRKLAERQKSELNKSHWFPKTSRKAEKRTQQALLVPEN
ncbi:hypothetical protein AMS60_18455 [Bacillus sp. FJAT-21945]|nr:hypothetical protein AMS60_18455 [Bacillus sp. FJAT-21945]